VEPSRPYRSAVREEQARATRRQVLAAATTQFGERGYAGTTMRSVAAAAAVSVPTVEQQFGTKARLLKAAIDIAIAGDDDQTPILNRDWTRRAAAATTAAEFLDVVVDVIARTQTRSAGLVLAVFEASSTDPALAEVAAQLVEQREITATWIVDGLITTAPLREVLARQDAIDTVWLLMDPALFDRLVRHRGWTAGRYGRWIAGTIPRLLVADTPDPHDSPHPAALDVPLDIPRDVPLALPRGPA